MASDPATLILTSLADGPKHGYALQQDIEAFAGVTLGPGTLYGAISRLEQQQLIEATGDSGRRRPYKLTQTGVEALQTTLNDMAAIVGAGRKRLSASPRVAPVGARA